MSTEISNSKMSTEISNSKMSTEIDVSVLKEAYINMGDYTLRFEFGELNAEDKEKARIELRETPEVVRESCEIFRNLLKNKEPMLYYPKEDDERLKVYLRPCKYYPESALEKMKKYYEFKVKHPKYYKDLSPRNESRAFYQNLFTGLPFRNKNGERVVIIEVGRKWNPKTCTLNEIVRSLMLMLEAVVEEPRTQICGVQIIIDLLGLSMQHVWQITPAFARLVVYWVQECIPVRIKGIHVVNQPYIFNMVYAIFKPFLGEKLQQRIHFHGTNFKSLHNHISSSILPLHLEGALNLPMDKGEEIHKCILKFEKEYEIKSRYGYASIKDC